VKRRRLQAAEQQLPFGLHRSSDARKTWLRCLMTHGDTRDMPSCRPFDENHLLDVRRCVKLQVVRALRWSGCCRPQALQTASVLACAQLGAIPTFCGWRSAS
jgi:hypothetical protein